MTLNKIQRQMLEDKVVQELDRTKILTGTSSPALAPEFIGQNYIDITAKVAYISVGLTSADWRQISI